VAVLDSARAREAPAVREPLATHRIAGLGNAYQVGLYLFLVVVVIAFVAPLLWLAILSLRPQGQVLTNSLLPSSLDWSTYARVFQKVKLAEYLKNSLVLAAGTIAVTLPLGSLAAYGFARWSFRGKDLLLFLFIFALTVPGLVNLIAIYSLFSNIGLLNSFAALILVYSAAAIPVTTWLMRAYLQTVPVELEEAAMIDGCTRVGALVRVTLPVSSPGLAAAALLVFVNVWHEFIVAQTLISRDALRVVSQGLFAMREQFSTDYTGLAAVAIVISVPVVLLFILLQERFVAGLTAGAVK
jgi:ABC-type glycerol-3-phosphate transport system permease component